MELRRLCALLGETARGHRTVALIGGEPGIGKTRLLTAGLAHAADQGIRVISGEADELGRHQPFAALAEALAREPDGSALAPVHLLLRGQDDGRRAGGHGDLTFQVVDGLVAAFEELSSAGPIVFALEDLHWADPSTLRVLRSMVRRLCDRPVGFLATVRRLPRSRELQGLLDTLVAEGAEAISLEPLPDDAVVALAATLIGARPGPRLRSRLASTGGNPLLVIEYLRALADDRAILQVDGTAETDNDALEPALRATILRRLGRVGDAAGRLLEIASVLGTSFRLADLAAITSRPAAELLAPVREAMRAGLVADDGDHLVFRHELVREAIYSDLPSAVRKDLHREAGQVLARSGAPVGRIAEQLALGAPVGDAETVKWLRTAARQAARGSPVAAASLLERALRIGGPQSPERQAITAELIPLLVMTGRLTEYERLRETLGPEDVLDPPQLAGYRLGVAHALVRRGRWRDAAEQLAPANRQPAGGPPALALGPRSFIQLVAGNVGAAARDAAASLAAAEQTSSQAGTVTALMTLTWVKAAAGDLEEAVVLGSRAVAVARRSTSLFAGFLFPHLCLGGALMDADRHEEADAAFHAGIARAHELLTPAWLPYYHAGLAIKSFHTGAWDDARSAAETALTLGEETLTRWTHQPYALLARIALARDDLPAAAEAARAACAELGELPPAMGANWALWAQALVAEAEGARDDAVELMTRAWHTVPELRHLFGNRLIPADTVRLALAAGDQNLATHVTAAVEALADRIGSPAASAAALRCRGLLNDDPETLLRAATTYQHSARIFEHALACADAAVALARAGRATEARPMLDRALAGYHRLGATRESARAIAMLREHGIRRGERGPRRRAATGWPALTRTELAVTRLVAEGLTNRRVAARLFISRYTVETHLKHIFAKLEVTTRAELTAIAIRHGQREDVTDHPARPAQEAGGHEPRSTGDTASRVPGR
jgi:DNA-binding CsgD family transcriptional regulator/tetratricopeptide (TPR) repeat protein